MSSQDLAAFEALRARLFAIAYRVLGSVTEADDVVQDAWIRWHNTDRTKVRSTTAFLAATTTRLALNVAQSARVRREFGVDFEAAVADAGADPAVNAEQRALLDDAVTVLLARLSPTERAAYVLREAFDYPYRDIGHVLGLKEATARQIVNRSRVRLSRGDRLQVTAAEHRGFVEMFITAARSGELAPLERVAAHV